MALNIVTLGYEYFPDPTVGRPVFNGSIYVGQPNTDPTIPSNQKSISVRQEDGTIVPVSQPVNTGAGGVVLYNGSPVEIVVDGSYSLAVLNDQGAQVYYLSEVFSDGTAITADNGIIRFDTVADMVANADLAVGNIVQTAGYLSKGDGGDNRYEIVAAGTGTADGGSYIDLSGITGQAKGLFPSGEINVKQFGAYGDGATDDYLSVLSAFNYIATLKPDFGGYTVRFPAVEDFYVMSQGIDFESIFNLTTPASQRLTQIWVEGDGRSSHIRYTGSGQFLFKVGSYANNVGMTGGFRRIKIDTNALIGHLATAYTPTFTSITSGAYGSTNTTTTGILCETVISGFSIEDCEISLFNKGVHMRNGFAPTVEDCNISKCNIGIEGGDLLTSLTLDGGNTIEECAVGWFINSGAQMFKSSGINVIEANDVDVLMYAKCHLHDLSGIYHEGSRRSHFFSADATVDDFTPRQIKIENCIGLNIETNGGLLEVQFLKCSFASGFGAVFGINAGQRLQHIVIEDCFDANQIQPFDSSLITGSGIYSQFTDEIFVKSKGKSVPYLVNGDPKLRPCSELKQVKQFYTTAADTLSEGFSLDIPNLKTAVMVVIEGHKNYDIEVGAALPNPVYFKYVGIVHRNTGAATTISWSATENVFESFATTLTPHVVSTPTTSVTGAISATQTVQFDFIQGYTGNVSAGHYYNVTLHQSIGNVDFV